MYSSLTNKDQEAVTRFLNQLLGVVLIAPAGMVLFFAMLLWFLAELVGLSGFELSRSFVSEAAPSWFDLTAKFLLLPYFIAAAFFVTLIHPSSEKLSPLWISSSNTSNIPVSSLEPLRQWLAYDRNVRWKASFVAGESPQLN